MALVDILIGVVIGFVGGVLIPAGVLYWYRYEIGQWIIERQAKQSFEKGLGLEDAFANDGMGEDPFAAGGMDEGPFATGGMDEDPFGNDGTGEAGFGNAGSAVEVETESTGESDAGRAGQPGAGGTGQPDAGAATDSGSGTRRCDCGALVSPRLDDECPECGAPVSSE
jgi:hypothetical protein